MGVLLLSPAMFLTKIGIVGAEGSGDVDRELETEEGILGSGSERVGEWRDRVLRKSRSREMGCSGFERIGETRRRTRTRTRPCDGDR